MPSSVRILLDKERLLYTDILTTIGPLVQAWFAYRVLKLSGKLYIPVLCWFLSFLRCAATVAVGIEALLSTSVLKFEKDFKWLLTFILAVGAAVDVIIAGSLCYFFRQLRATSFHRTVKVINQAMIWTVGTSYLNLTSVAGLLNLNNRNRSSDESFGGRNAHLRE